VASPRPPGERAVGGAAVALECPVVASPKPPGECAVGAAAVALECPVVASPKPPGERAAGGAAVALECPIMTHDDYLGRVRALLAAVRDRALQAEQLRRLPDDTFKDFQAAGLFRCIQPKRYEGYELDPGTFYRAVMEVGAVCGSSGWVLAVLGVHNWHLALFPPQAQGDVWGEDTSIQVSTGLSPPGMVVRADGGSRCRGRG